MTDDRIDDTVGEASMPAYDLLADKPDDPWPLIARDRAHCPVIRHPTLGIYQVTGHAPLERILKDWQTFSSVGTVNSRQEDILAFTDPPRHTRQRRIFSRALGARRVAEAEGMIQRTTDRVIDRLSGRTSVDVVEEFANPLVLAVVVDLLGVPASDIPRFRAWTKAAERNSHSPNDSDKATLREFRRYSSELIATRLADPDPPDDLLTAMLTAEWEDDRLTDREVSNILEFLLVAANSTTTDAIGNLVWALESNPEQKALLLSDLDSGITGAVEEILRFDGPIHALQRTVTSDTEIAGVPVPGGSLLLNVYGGCSHDPAAYDDPDAFRIDRDWSTIPQHYGFGWGTHYCLGAHLARKEIAIAITTLYQRLENLRREPGFSPRQVPAPYLRGWQEVRVEFDRVLEAPS